MTERIKSQLPIKVVVFGFAYIVTIGSILGTIFLVPNQFDTFEPLRMLIIIFASILLTKYFFYMIVSPLDSISSTFSKIYWRKKIPQYEPLVSVLIPAWNEEVGIILTIESLLANSYKNLEIVVVNDGSTDGSDALIKKFIRKYKSTKESKSSRKKIVYYYKENGGKGSALNKAIEISTGEILISIDADCVVNNDTIKNFVEYFRNPNVMAAVGKVKIGNIHSLLGLIQSLEFMFSFYFKKADSFMNTIYIIGGAAGAFRRTLFEKLGGYNTENITEDIELSMRIQDAGKRIVYASDAVVYTEGASDLASLKKQRLRWKQGRFQTFYNFRHMFGSLRPRHNKVLTFLILPLALFAELQLVFEIPFVIFLFVYSLISSDFSSFVSGIIVVASMFFFLIIFEDKSTRRFSFYVLAPIAWFLFYLMTYVEATALKNSIKSFITGKQVVWQKWERKGINI